MGRQLPSGSRKGALGRSARAGQAVLQYLDVDGDGIPYRTLPGVHPKGAYFTRGSGHNKLGGYTEDDAEYTEVLDRVARKIESAARAVPPPVVHKAAGARLGLLTVGGCHGACVEAMHLLARDGRIFAIASAQGRS